MVQWRHRGRWTPGTPPADGRREATKEQYIDKTFRQSSLDLIDHMNAIIDDYSAQDYELTLRQLYYQLVARGIIPNTERSYKNVGELVNNARLAGLMDWNAIVDRTRYVRALSHYDGEADMLDTAAQAYRLDKWENQPNYVEVWIEKDALISIAEQAARALDVPCFSCRGYTSQSEMYEAAQRFKQQSHREGRYIIHLGDHDPSGLDMTRDITDRLAMFGADVQVERIALNRDQIDLYNPPPNPAKITDTRAKAYITRHGHESWELDALDPATLDRLIKDKIIDLMDIDLYNSTREMERQGKTNLDRLSQYAAHHGTERILNALQTAL